VARLNVDDTFWVQVGRVERGMLTYDQVVGNALRLLRFGQEQYKNGNLISHDQWKMEGFFDCLVPVFAERLDEGYLIHGSDEKFGWLRQKVEAGRNGGKKSGEARRSEINTLDEAAGSGVKRLEPSYSSSPSSSQGSKEPLLNTAGDKEQLELETNPLQWLIDLWNSNRGPMPELKKITKGTARFKHVMARLKDHPDPETWLDVFTRMEQSDFVSGRSGAWNGGGFDWVMESASNVEKVLAGNYNPRPKEEKKDTWLERAELVKKSLNKVSAYSNDGGAQLKALLGEDLFKITIKVKGGTHAIRMMRDNEYTNRNIAALLKESYAELKQQGVLK